MKKIFMASLVAMMAVTTANAQIASTEYTDATFVAKDGFDALVGGTTQVTANKSAIATINGRVGNISKENMGTKAGTVVEAIKEVVTEKADKATTYTKDEADAEFMTSAEVTDAISNATSADSAQVAANKTDIANINKSAVMTSGVTAATVTQVATNASDIADLQVGKVDKNQTAANAKKAMVTDDKGDVVPGLITEGMISGNAVKLDHLNSEVKAVLGDGVNAMEAIEGMNSETTGAGPIVKSVTQTEGKVTVGLGYIETADINKVAVTTEKIADANVTTAKIADSAVTTEKIAGKNVTAEKLAVGSVITEKIAAGAVTTDKIQDRAVGGAKIADSGVATRNIADDAIVTSKILDASVTKAKLDASVKATLDKADNAMQETGLKALPSWGDQNCGDTNVTCSLVSKSGIIAWEAVKY